MRRGRVANAPDIARWPSAMRRINSLETRPAFWSMISILPGKPPAGSSWTSPFTATLPPFGVRAVREVIISERSVAVITPSIRSSDTPWTVSSNRASVMRTVPPACGSAGVPLICASMIAVPEVRAPEVASIAVAMPRAMAPFTFTSIAPAPTGTQPVPATPDTPEVEPDSAGDQRPLGLHIQRPDACACEVRLAHAGDGEVVIAARRGGRSGELRRAGQRAGEIELGVGERSEGKRREEEIRLRGAGELGQSKG